MSEPSGRFGIYVHFLIWALALVEFYLTSRYSLPLFRGIAGLLSVVIAGGDPAMLRWLLSILLGNAWKFTETVPRGKIEFEALPTTDGTRGFLVRGNRAGLAPSSGHSLFRVFHRLHATRDFSGPGLAMVQRIIQRHGGRVWAEIDLRQGATFYFTLPPPGQGSAAKPSGEDQPDSLTGSP